MSALPLRWLHLVRHGETALSGTGVIAGRLDVPLSSRGEEQARAAARALRARSLAAVVSSPLSRARATAELVAAPHGLAVEIEPDLRELDFGVAEGLTFDELERLHPEVAATWLARPHEVVFPGGEGRDDIAARVVRAAHAIAARHPRGECAVVSHAGPIRVLLGLARRLEPGAALALPCAHGSITSVGLYPTDFGVALREPDEPDDAVS